MTCLKWISLHPPLSSSKSAGVFQRCALAVIRSQSHNTTNHDQVLSDVMNRTLTEINSVSVKDRTILSAAVHVLLDLARQRWRIRVHQHIVAVCPPEELQADPKAEKARIRRQELIKRDEQLAQPSVRRFIQDMERQRLHANHFVSIFSLMRDGRDLVASLQAALKLTDQQRVEELRRVVDPYVQFVTEDGRCEFTGFRLQDIWRYFRHTWTNQYTSTPGRTMALLIRDRAAPLHPVIGIAALASPIVQIKERDTWIGWHPTAFFENVSEHPSPQLGAWLRRVVNRALAEIYTDDFIAEALISVTELHQPTADTLARLSAFGMEERRLHHRYVRAQEHKGNGALRRDEDSENRWLAKARTHLFRSKRALALMEMLRAREVIERHLGIRPTTTQVATLLADREGKVAIAKILRKAKANRIGIAMADITVCGAIAPYNAILGGKLIAMLAASPEVIQAYRQRYGTAESEIASSIAARPIVRPADLVLLGTTSLYGIGSSQYNRIRIPAERLGGAVGQEIRYVEIGRSEAFGTSQFSSATVDALVQLVHHSNGGQRVNSIFGEGVSPKFRKVRNGLDVLRFPAEHLLRHGRRRIVYGISVVRNTREFLLGMDDKPDYIFTLSGADASFVIADWWRERWLANRIEQERVLTEVARHTLVRPVRHGARVRLPGTPDQPLFVNDKT